MLMKTLSSLQKKTLKKIAEKYQLNFLILFGSLAQNKERKDSDADVAVSGKEKLNFDKQLLLIRDLEEVFNRKIDLSFTEFANPLLLKQISKNGILLCGSKKDFFNFKLYAFHRFNDYLPYFKREERLVKELVRLNN